MENLSNVSAFLSGPTGEHLDNMIKELTPTLGKIFELKLVLNNYVVVTDPDLVKEVRPTDYATVDPVLCHTVLRLVVSRSEGPSRLWIQLRCECLWLIKIRFCNAARSIKHPF